jgi:tetratricopeptide (TPR) repeat protein
MYALELHHWAEAAALIPVPGADASDSSITYWARAIGAAHSGNVAEARKDIEQMESIHRNLVSQKKTRFAKAVESDRREAAAWVAHAEGKDDEAIKALRSLADDDEGVSEASDGIPAREMLADMLLEMKRPEQALIEYEADLKANPNRFDGLYGAARAAEMAGKSDKANTYYAQLVKSCNGSNSGRPELNHARKLLAKK